MQPEKTITFFYTDGNEKQTTATVAEEAATRGYTIRYSPDLMEPAEIGFYCQHHAYPENSKLSIIMLHDMAQGHNRWPDFWCQEPWNGYDIGILPGPSWHERWNRCADFPYAQPRLGVRVCGWPKADLIFRNTGEFGKQIDELRKKLRLTHDKTVLYAPSWENDNKQDDVVQALKDLPVNILLKQAPYVSDAKKGWVHQFPQMVRDIERMNRLHRDCAPNVHIIDPDLSIMYCLGLSDVMVSDESSVMVEALLLDVPSIGVTDWLIPDQVPSRFSDIPFDFALTTTKDAIESSVERVLDEHQLHRFRLQQFRNHHFSNPGSASATIINTIDTVLEQWELSSDKRLPRTMTPEKFVHAILAFCEEKKFSEALSFYFSHRNEIPNIREIARVDAMMRTLHERENALKRL